MLKRLAEKQDVVLATGGGAVLDRDNRSLLITRGFVIYLYAPIEYLVKRTARDRNRPLLQTDDPRSRLEAIVAERDPLYRQIADLVITTDKRSARYVVKEIVKKLGAI